MRIPTRSEQAASALRRAVPVIGLSVTVIAGVVLGLWMVSVALWVPVASRTAAPGQGHADSAAPHGHPQADTAGMAGMSDADMAGMNPQEMAAMGQPAPTANGAHPMTGMSSADVGAMTGMSSADMAAMTHSEEPAAAGSARPLAATLAGFAFLNLSVLIAAVVAGRRRKAHSKPRPQRRGGPANRGRSQTPPPVPVTAPVPSAPVQSAPVPSAPVPSAPVPSAPVPSAPVQSAPDSAGSLS